ncbi:MAG: hypothetical protein IJ218_01975 [Alphaproteobacteria bacterium]|nr:hypothetical protein [Alphaproteobacteria bacterium]
MKHLHFYIVFILIFFNSAVLATQPELPADFKGETTKQVFKIYAQDTPEDVSLSDRLNAMYEVALYLYQKYSLEEMAKKSFIHKIRPFFPYDDDNSLESKREWLYNGAEVYQYGKKKYTDFINKYLVPRTYKKVHSYDEYDHNGEVSYIEVPKGEFVKVYNFKKFLSYSNNIEERLAIKEFEAKQRGEANWLDKIDETARRIEWNKVALYGIKYDNPLYSKQGITQAQSTKNAEFRLVSRYAYIQGRKKLQFGLQMSVAKNSFILANNISPILKKPQIDLSNSENIAKEYQILYPIPMRSVRYPDMHKYTQNNMIIFEVNPLDLQKDVILRAKISVTECDYYDYCQPYVLNFEQTIKPNGTELLDNGFDNYFFKTAAQIPPSNNKKLELKRFQIYQNADKQSLYLEFKHKNSVGKFDVFIEDTDGKITFKEPQIRLRSGLISVLMEPTEESSAADLSNAEYIVSANLNENILLRKTLVPEKNAKAEIFADAADLNILLMALLCGLLLNIMPCVFPLLAGYVGELYRLHKYPAQNVRQHLQYFYLGIFIVVIITVLCLIWLKINHLHFGWGTQLQNMPFIVSVIFGGIYLVSLFKQLFDDAYTSKKQALTFMLDTGCGLAVGVLALSCGAPYIFDVFYAMHYAPMVQVIIMALALLCGFFLPLWLLYLSAEPQKWLILWYKQQKNIKLLIKISISLAFVWYLILLWEQTPVSLVFKIILIGGVFAYLLNICKKFLQYLRSVFDEHITLEHLQKFRRGTYVFSLLLLIAFAIPTGWYAHIFQKRARLTDAALSQYVDEYQIQTDLNNGHSVIVAIGADWCFLCRVNDFLIFNVPNLKKWGQRNHLKLIRINIDGYNPKILQYMQNFSANSAHLPFYVLYTPIIRRGIVLAPTSDIGQIDALLLNNN